MTDDNMLSPLTTDFSKFVGKKISLVGTISQVQWQHILQRPPDTHKNIQFLDLEDEYQIVLYTKEEITSRDKIEVKGEIISVSRNTEQSGAKYDEEFVEYQMIVDEYVVAK